jgi:uncharacterized delta-60 repeat protein
MRQNRFTGFFIFFLLGFYSLVFSQVTEEWVRIINGPANLSDHGHDVKTDLAGNIYVTGWIEITPGNTDCHTVKYSPGGDLLWSKTYAGSANGIDYGYTLAVDENGNAYVGGYGSSGNPTWDIFILKYNTNGDTVWTRRWTSPIANYSAYAYSIKVDQNENVYVTGWMSDGFTGGEFVTLKYNSAGNLQWARSYKGPGTSIDYSNCIVVDNNGNVYITGWSGGENNLHDMTTIKYSPDGDSLWVRRYNGTANDNDYAYWLDLDNEGNIYVTGQSVETGSDNDITTIKYSPDGDVLWIKHYNGPSNGYDAGWTIAVDDEGSAFVTGNHTTANGLNGATLKYTSAGDLSWVSTFDGPGSGGDIFFTMVLDDSSNVYVSGFVSNAGTSDIGTVKYDSSGNEKWAVLYNGEANSYDGAYIVTLDNSQNVIVTGYSSGNGTDYNYTTIKYSQPVIPVELSSFTADVKNNVVTLNWTTASEINNYGFEIQKSRDNKNYNKIGFVNGNGTVTESVSYSFIDELITEGKSFYRLKQIDFNGSYEYSKTVEVEINLTPVEYALHQNYPNPFNPATRISFSLADNSEVLLRVYNILGQEVATLIKGYLDKGVHQVEFDASEFNSGIYFYEININNNNSVNFSSVKKMMLTK